MAVTLWKGVLRYWDSVSGMTWSIANHRLADGPDAFQGPADVWNSVYFGACAETVQLVDLRVYNLDEIGVYRVYNKFEFTDKEGAIAGNPTEISSYAQLRGFGSEIGQGSSAWKLHGISDTLVTGSYIDPVEVKFTNIIDASVIYFRQYRPEAGVHVPAMPVPIAFASFQVSGCYGRRTGRPFISPGQQRRYTRTG